MPALVSRPRVSVDDLVRDTEFETGLTFKRSSSEGSLFEVCSRGLRLFTVHVTKDAQGTPRWGRPQLVVDLNQHLRGKQ